MTKTGCCVYYFDSRAFVFHKDHVMRNALFMDSQEYTQITKNTSCDKSSDLKFTTIYESALSYLESEEPKNVTIISSDLLTDDENSP